jgi:3-hydroxyacyl-[acyl-carrier-protein] dehydratase
VKRPRTDALELGPSVVKLLLPHRPPLLLVDRVIAYSGAPQPSVTAERFISASEPVFAGHFPAVAMWPGAYTIEGLAQTFCLAVVISQLVGAAEQRGESARAVLDGLQNLERGYRLQPGFRPDDIGALRTQLRAAPRQIATLAAVDVKLVAPVFAGVRLEYCARVTHGFDALMRCEVDASVGGRTVAKGVLTGATGVAPPDPPPP